MDNAYDILRNIQLVEYLALGFLAIRVWRSRRDSPSRWLLATFGALALVVGIARLLPQNSDASWAIWAAKFLLAALVLFPYCLYRFVRVFVIRPYASIYWVANGLTAAVIIYTFLIPRLQTRGAPRNATTQYFILLLLVQWTFLSVIVGTRLWRAGRGQATVARRRMRTMSFGAVAFALLLIISGARPAASSEHTAFQIFTQVLGILVAPFFILGFATPRWVVTLWRRKDEQALRLAEIELVKATSPSEVASGLLPQATRMIGATAGMLYDSALGVIGSFQLDDERLRSLGLRAKRRERSDDVATEIDSIWVPIPSGWLTFLTSSYAPFFGQDEANTLKALGVLTDLALAKAQLFERERLQKEAMRDFVAIASHDLRTPITVIEGFTTTLLMRWEDVPDQDKRKFLKAMDRQVTHLKRLVEDLLTVSRIEGGAIIPNTEAVDLKEAIDLTISDLGESVPRIDVSVQPGLRIEVDPDHLHRMLANYLRNSAIHGAPPYSLTANAEDGFVEIRVVDNGPGVPDDLVPRLFGKFERADRKTSSSTQGTGLGLSIVRGLARVAGGDVWYERNEPSGAVFGLRLPRNALDSWSRESRSEQDNKSTHARRG
ncbi:MAG: HAMP domain-containing histidine kinase [Actinobacteria bacterium]|nr:HAMP domain-containing histidine kinase [Actinomycetota bacterium]